MKVMRALSFVLFAALVLSACAPAVATTVPAPVTAAPVQPTEVPTATQPPAPTPVASIPADSLAQKNHLLICTDFPYPPQEFFDENGNPQGLDVEIGNEIAVRLGLQVQYVNSVFDTIIAAVTSGKCDIIISAQNITADRSKQISQIPYFKAGQSMVAAKGNPDNINTTLDLCGKAAAAESGTTEADYLQGTGDYAGKGLSKACTDAGKPAIDVVVTQKDTDALQQLQAGKVAVYFADSPVAAYYTVQHPDQFQLVGQVLEPINEGIGVPCGQADCTGAALSPVGQAVKAALDSMIADGTYLKILTKWNLQDSAVTP
ncbi:MAG TPA: transporter substrate-binding domain-containing protein [Anaerolineales bacterium]|nr:transporter substrate-binding domain-containing protein [Anaerolineales bacterium]